jgi:hypothetical protein
MKMRLPRPLYVAVRMAEMFVGLISRGINGSLPGGSTFQTTSARAHLRESAGWARARRIINAAFFWQEDHCAHEWQREVENARKTLARAVGQ